VACESPYLAVAEPAELEEYRERHGEVSGVVRGRVTDANGDPLPQARVGIEHHHGSIFLSTVGENGYFKAWVWTHRFRYREFTVGCTHPGFMGVKQYDVALGDPDLRFTLHPSRTIILEVVDAQTGEPVTEYATVFSTGLRNYCSPERRPTPRRRDSIPAAEHHPEGRCVRQAVYEGCEEYHVFAKGFAPGYRSVNVQPGDEPLVLRYELEREILVRGRVVDVDGAPVANASLAGNVDPYRFGLHSRIIDYAQSRSGTDGRFTVEGLASGKNAVWAAHPDLLHASQTVTLRHGAPPPEVELVLRPPAVLAGVVAIDGQPVAGQRVYLRIPIDETSATGKDTHTNDDGRYVFEHLYPGQVQVRVDWEGPYEGFPAAYYEAELRSGETTTLDFEY
jgi:hypothetical protein